MRAAFQGKEPQICAKECTIEKIIVLPVQQYEKFTKNLLQRYDFIAENLNLMGISGDTWNCILVTARGVQRGCWYRAMVQIMRDMHPSFRF